MGSTPLSGEEMALLPPIRPRWQAHLVALVAVLSVLVIHELWAWTTYTASSPAVMGAIGPLLSSPLWLLVRAALGLFLSPLLFRVGFGWGTETLPTVVPFAAPFVGWVIGFRLAHLPYRDWRPSDKQRPTVRLIPCTGYHVLQADLDRLAKHEHTLQASRTNDTKPQHPA